MNLQYGIVILQTAKHHKYAVIKRERRDWRGARARNVVSVDRYSQTLGSSTARDFVFTVCIKKYYKTPAAEILLAGKQHWKYDAATHR